PLLRGYYDWFDRNPYLPELLRRAGQGVQGMIANTRVYFTPVGKPEDLQVVQRYFQENYWLDELARREDRAIWQYPYDHPHCYLLTSLEPYLDLANQAGSKGFRYHANLVGKKDPVDSKNTCCEGQGTRLIGSLPEYLYSVAPDGLYVDMFSPATIEWKQEGRSLQARMTTDFP